MSDTIYRQAAIDAMELAKEQYFDRRVIIGKMQDIVSNLPSAEPDVLACGSGELIAYSERKKGKWIPFDVPWYQCSECGAVRENKSFMEHFCPYCGADMRGEEDECM